MYSVAAGLPNITGSYNSDRWGNWTGCQKGFVGALGTTLLGVNKGGTNVNGIEGVILHLDASQSSEIYSNSDTVTPLSMSVVHIIKY